MKRRCPQSKLVCKAVLKGYKLLFNKYSTSWNGSVADIMKSYYDDVWGLVYSVTFDDLKRLDKFEGYPRSYNRKLLTVFSADNRVIDDVWVYYISYKYKDGVPTGEYLDIIKDAAYSFNFPRYYKKMLNGIKINRVEVLEDDDLWIENE